MGSSLRIGATIKLNTNFREFDPIYNCTFKLSRRGGMLFFADFNVVSYQDIVVPAVNVQHLWRRVVINRRFTKLQFKTQ